MSNPHSADWQASWLEFDRNPMVGEGDMDSALQFAIVCIGGKRSAFWNGSDWTYTEHEARLYHKREAATILASLPLFRYCRLYAQKPGLPYWPTVGGWHHREPFLGEAHQIDLERSHAEAHQIDLERWHA